MKYAGRVIAAQAPGSVLPPVICWTGRDGIHTLVGHYVIWFAIAQCWVIGPDGFEWNGHSVPPVIHPLLRPHQLSPVAGLFHDLPYRYAGKLPPELTWPEGVAMTRLTVDLEYYRIMKLEQVHSIKRRLAFTAVQGPLGQRAWDKWERRGGTLLLRKAA